MGQTRPYNRDSLTRALVVHSVDGPIRDWSPPEPNGRRTWIVTTFEAQFEFTSPQVFAFVAALATSARFRERQTAEV